MRKVALFKHIEMDFESIWEVKDQAPQGWVQVSEPVEVEFKPLASATVIQEQLTQLEEARKEVVEKFAKMLKTIDDRKAQLQAITYEVAA